MTGMSVSMSSRTSNPVSAATAQVYTNHQGTTRSATAIVNVAMNLIVEILLEFIDVVAEILLEFLRVEWIVVTHGRSLFPKNHRVRALRTGL